MASLSDQHKDKRTLFWPPFMHWVYNANSKHWKSTWMSSKSSYESCNITIMVSKFRICWTGVNFDPRAFEDDLSSTNVVLIVSAFVQELTKYEECILLSDKSHSVIRFANHESTSLKWRVKLWQYKHHYEKGTSLKTQNSKGWVVAGTTLPIFCIAKEFYSPRIQLRHKNGFWPPSL